MYVGTKDRDSGNSKDVSEKKRVGEIKNESVVLQDGVLNQNQEKESACSERFWGMD